MSDQAADRGNLAVCPVCAHYSIGEESPRHRCMTPMGVRMVSTSHNGYVCCSHWYPAAQYSHIVQRLMQVGSESEARARRTVKGLIIDEAAT